MQIGPGVGECKGARSNYLSETGDLRKLTDSRFRISIKSD